MAELNKTNTGNIKSNLHPRNKNRGQYNFIALIKACPELNHHVNKNQFGNLSINYFDPLAVKILNKSLLKYLYQIDWDIPDGFLTPPIPGRSDYIHYLADLLVSSNLKSKPINNSNINFLDIGTGSNCIYPIIGVSEYGWSCVASDISSTSIKHAQSIIDANPSLHKKIELRQQPTSKHYFNNIIQDNEYFDFSMSNPPFFASLIEANQANSKKQKNLTKDQGKKTNFNFGGNSDELWCKGGELQFIKQLIQESYLYQSSCFWFTTLVSKKENIKSIEFELQKHHPTEVKLIEMSQGHKSSRIIAWTFLNKKQKDIWRQSRWL